MRSRRAIELTGPPRLWRSVSLEGLALAVLALVAGLPWAGRDRRPEPRAPEPPKQEVRRIRVVQLPPSPPARNEPRPAPRAAPVETARSPRPRSPATAPQKSAPEQRRARIAVDAPAVQGIRLRVLVPRPPGDRAPRLGDYAWWSGVAR